MQVKYLRASTFGFLNPEIRKIFLSQGMLPVVINDAYIPHLFRPERIQIWYGGSGAAKSDSKATELLLKCLLMPYCRVMYVRKVYDTIRMSQFQLFKDVIKRYGLEQYFKVREDGMTITCTQNSNMLFARGLDDVDKITSIAEVTDIWIEEPIDRKGSISSSDFTELNRRLRCPKAGNHIHFTFNPITRDGWIHDYFFKSNEYEAFTLKTTYLDNHFTPSDQVRQFEILKSKKPEEYQVYALGEWGKLKQGLVFPEYTIIPEMPTDLRKSGYGMDWGFYPDPWTLTKCGTKDGVLFLDELFYETGHTSETRTKAMLGMGLTKGIAIAADNNNEAIEEMRKKGWSNIVAVRKGPGSVKAGIDKMKGFKLAITERSKNLKKELDNYSWAVDKKTELPTGEPIDAFNHCFVAGTLVLTDKGQKPIELIEVGDIVLTEKGFRQVAQTHKRTPKEQIKKFEIKTNGGDFPVTCTVNHKVKINGKWQEIQALKQGDRVMIVFSSIKSQTHSLVECAVLQVTQEDQPQQQVYDIGVCDCHSFIANGLLVHNCIDGARYWTVTAHGNFTRVVG